MARCCSVLTLYGLNFLLFLVAGALLAMPWVGIAASHCHVNASALESLRYVRLLQIVGGALLLFSLLGCCLAKSGKKRYRFPYILVCLAAVVAGAAVLLLNEGLLYDKIATYDPDAPQQVQQAIDGLASSSMQAFYKDFASIMNAGDCDVSGTPSCGKCPPLEVALDSCTKDWHPSKAGVQYLASCTKQFEHTQEDCGEDCTRVFCECADLLETSIEEGAQYTKYGLLGLCGVLLLLLVAGVFVSRPQPPPVEPQQVLLLQTAHDPRQPRAQPVLA